MKLRTWVAVLALLGCGAPQPADDRGAEHPRHDHAAGHPHAQGGEHHPEHHHDFSDVARFERMFDDPARDEWQQPAEVVRLLELREGMTVVDLGAGTGYFLRHLAQAVGASGRVLALDTERAMVAHMERRIEREGLASTEARVAPADDPALEASSVDRILVVDTWHHIADRERYAARLRDALRPGGFVLVVDFTLESPHGPPAAMRLAPDVVSRELSAGGLHASVAPESLPYQYAVRAER
jgi:cyclopropane fatty-acyl-phospholipid synthase-like methyltransferase